MKKFLFFTLFVSHFAFGNTQNVIGEYSFEKGSSGRSNSPKNHKYLIDLKVSQKINVKKFIGGMGFNFNLLNENGEQVEGLESLGDLITGKDSGINFDLQAGKYYLEIYSFDNNQIGKYRISVTGKLIPNIKLISINKSIDILNNNFSEYGGAGKEYSPRSKEYSFTVKEDFSWIQFDISSKNANTWMEVINELGETVKFEYTYRSGFLLCKLNTGTYKLWIGTLDKNAKSDFILRAFGNLEINKVENEAHLVETGTWLKKDDRNFYNLKVDTDNTNYEIILQSKVLNQIVLKNELNETLKYESNRNFNSINGFLKSGNYVLEINPNAYNPFTENINFKMIVLGNIKLSKKQL